MEFESKAVHAGKRIDENAGAVAPPIYLSTTFRRDPEGNFGPKGFFYTRLGNPNRSALEKKIAELECGAIAFAYSSGMASTLAVVQSVLSPGAHAIISDDCYFDVRRLIGTMYKRWNVSYSEVDMTEPANVARAIRANTKLILIETPSNPLLRILDIKAIASIAKANSILLAADNTWATPCTIQPLKLGADLVIHSSTKYFGGHSDVLGGCVVVKEIGDIADRLQEFQTTGGVVPSPFDCWLIFRGLSTLPVRQEAQARSAAAIAHFLDRHDRIEKVYYPGLTTHLNHSVAVGLMRNNFGAMLSILVKGGKGEAMKFAGRLKLFQHATSLGGVESLVDHRLTAEGAYPKSPENLIRISVGLEKAEDLIADLQQALDF